MFSAVFRERALSFSILSARLSVIHVQLFLWKESQVLPNRSSNNVDPLRNVRDNQKKRTVFAPDAAFRCRVGPNWSRAEIASFTRGPADERGVVGGSLAPALYG